ncbi:hypothetical protein ABEW19_19910 [Paenibacillus illinoisensis]|uniref:hypothetical protein n=1 Tax=Paenibacillus illinoisensis TaxID=59845 RepID=UPI003D2D1DB9
MRYVAPAGLARLAISLDARNYLPLASEGTYSDKNLAMTKAITAWNAYNENVVQETNELGDNVRKTAHISFPSDMPVLFFSREDDRVREDGKSLFTFLQTQLTDHPASTIIPLQGHHYFHWTQSKEMNEAVLKFMKDIEDRE